MTQITPRACVLASHPSARNAEEWGTLIIYVIEFAPGTGSPSGLRQRPDSLRMKRELLKTLAYPTITEGMKLL